MEKELNLLEEFLIQEEKKRKRTDLSQEERKEIDERIDRIIRISKIVNSTEKALPDNSREGLSYVAERLLNESASAQLKVDADGQIEMTVLDSIFEPKILAKLQMQKIGNSLFIIGFNFCQ